VPIVVSKRARLIPIGLSLGISENSPPKTLGD
jgi:hypothetical protein